MKKENTKEKEMKNPGKPKGKKDKKNTLIVVIIIIFVIIIMFTGNFTYNKLKENSKLSTTLQKKANSLEKQANSLKKQADLLKKQNILIDKLILESGIYRKISNKSIYSFIENLKLEEDKIIFQESDFTPAYFGIPSVASNETIRKALKNPEIINTLWHNKKNIIIDAFKKREDSQDIINALKKLNSNKNKIEGHFDALGETFEDILEKIEGAL